MKRELEPDEAAEAAEGDAKRAATGEETAAAASPEPVPAVSTNVAVPPEVPLGMVATGSAALDAILAANPALVDGPPAMMEQNPFEAEVNFKLELHADAVVAIFSYEGLTITTIRERTDCRMRLLGPGSDPTMRAFEMSGAQDAALQACGLILAEMQKSCSTNTNVCTPAAEGPTYSVRLLVRSYGSRP